MILNILPKISIITPSFNQGRYLEQCILSVMNQGYEDFEHIVIDGGSSDETISILEKYPHVTWISEPDDGQADALNKGFDIATGSLFGWLNSDDFYAPGIFAEVVQNLQDYPIIMGACELTDVNGIPKTRIMNTERSWFELLKYWVPYSIPTQPSLFFTKEVLDLVRRPDNLIFDPSLHYCMDYDLWLRISQSFPFSHRLEETLAFYRMTPENKTSDSIEGMPYAEPEMSRVHRRYREYAFDCSFEMSIIIPCTTIVANVIKQLESLTIQAFKDFEVLLVLPSSSNENKKELEKDIASWNERVRKAGFSHYAKIVQSEEDMLGGMLNSGINASEGRILVTLNEASKTNCDFISLHQTFQKDSIGISTEQGVLAARRILLLEIDGFKGTLDSFGDIKQELASKAHERSWLIKEQ